MGCAAASAAKSAGARAENTVIAGDFGQHCAWIVCTKQDIYQRQYAAIPMNLQVLPCPDPSQSQYGIYGVGTKFTGTNAFGRPEITTIVECVYPEKVVFQSGAVFIRYTCRKLGDGKVLLSASMEGPKMYLFQRHMVEQVGRMTRFIEGNVETILKDAPLNSELPEGKEAGFSGTSGNGSWSERMKNQDVLPGEPPSYWVTGDKPTWDKIDVTEEAQSTFQGLIDGTWKPTSTRDRSGEMPSGLVVKKVQRIEAPALWNCFRNKRSEINEKRHTITPISLLDGDGNLETGVVKTCSVVSSASHLMGPCWDQVNEHYLFHGTSPAGAIGIVREGFDLSRAGSVTGAMFGPGAYFAECASKADEYAVEDELSGFCALLVCRVACGQLHRTTRALDKALVENSEFKAKHHGVLGDREAKVGTYREFVVFEQEQVYPEYIVIYERRFS
jgi:hypothetical protein